VSTNIRRIRPAFDPAHLADLARSGLDEKDAVRMRTESLTAGQCDKLVGEARAGYLIPYFDLDGVPIQNFSRVRFTYFHTPEKFNGQTVVVKQLRYKQAPGTPVRLYLPPNIPWRDVLADVSLPVAVVEGEKKSFALSKHGFHAVGLGGVDCINQSRPKEKNKNSDDDEEPDAIPKVLLPELTALAAGGRRMIIGFDSDRLTKREVLAAEKRLAVALSAAGADVHIAELTSDDPDKKVGFDDLLVAQGPDAVRAVLESAIEFTPGILLIAGERARVLAQLAEAMPRIAERCDLMAYGGQLVHPFVTSRPGFRGRMVEVLELNPLTTAALASYIDERLRFTSLRSAHGVIRVVTEDCPSWLVTTYLDRADLVAQLPQQATGIATTPVWRDGQLIATRGFDLKSCKWVLAPAGVELPKRLSRKAALDALDVLRRLLSEFKFIDPRNHACAIALLLTAAMRASLTFAPLFVVTKHEHGEGGSTLCTLASIIQTGRHPAVITVDAESNASAEIEKRIDAAQLAGAANIVLDNFKTGGIVSSTSLATIVTEAERDVRILGLSKNVRCPNAQLVLVNGRNLTIAEDFIRRAVRIEIDTKMAKPDERKFKHPEILSDALRDRAAILSACFTIVAAYNQHSHKHTKVTNRAGFEDWVHGVAAPLAWLGMGDVSRIPDAQRAVDPERALIAQLLPSWEELCEEISTVKNGITISQSLTASRTGGASRTVVDVLAEATGAKIIADKPQLDSKNVGYFLRRIAGRVVDGRRLVNLGTTAGKARWTVQKVTE
jgi:hypothetical protein